MDWSRCNAPPFVAYQDGDGAWTRPDVTGNVARFTVSSPKGGFVYADIDGVTVRFMTQAELTASPIDLCPLKAGTNTVTGAAQPVTSSDLFTYNLGGGVGTSTTANPSITINGVRDGRHDLVAFGSQLAVGRAYIARDIDVPPRHVARCCRVGWPKWVCRFSCERQRERTVGQRRARADDELSNDAGVHVELPLHVVVVHVRVGGPSSQTFGFPEMVQRPTDFHSLTVAASQNGTGADDNGSRSTRSGT